ncbi:globin-coupled sensor protein [Rhizobium sp. BK491]|uniref:globin-coupled sensor protein n=1 Tax=Rhizobium sp. BK491 TaxID=2587009 RepID=UPI00160F5632|nr:globin-coupled sensor protein [Rhizobium sp. BK491]MBB3569516.1 methyl-accepting chemotaxis protein [Rhizobium sp. BK491]
MVRASKMDKLDDRLDFVGLGQDARQALAELQPTIESAVKGSLDTFYEKITKHPAMSKFFSSQQHVHHAKSKQQDHWKTIASGKYGPDYVEAVSAVGRTHARLGLEPRWYIGGYALILEGMVRSIVAQQLNGFMQRKHEQALSRRLSAIVKAALVDMDYGISVYLQVLADERDRAESERAAAQREQERALNALGIALNGLANGDLTADITEALSAEFEVLKSNYNESLASLGTAMQRIEDSVTRVRDEAGSISSAADNMARRTEQQASALEESAAAIDQITTISEQTAERTREVQAIVKESASEAERSREVVQQAVSAMGDIETSSRKMTDIISVIDDIAFQTNLLALNAGVEAARAGEQGKGFAVVAQEVRELAQRSATAAKEIKDLIDRSSNDVRRGVELVNRTGEALALIGNQVASIDRNVGAIARSAQEQAVGISEINSAVRNMDQMTQQNVALMEETNASTRHLADISNELAGLVGRFKTVRSGTRTGAVRLKLAS